MQKVYFVGTLSSVNRKEAAQIIRQCGGTVAKRLTPDVDMIVVSDESILKQDWNLWNDKLDAETREAFEKGKLAIIAETDFWEQYGNQDAEAAHTLYTSSMLAKLTGLPLSILRRLQREQLIIPVRQVFRLSYFGKEVILTLKIMQNMIKSGISISSAIQRLRKISRFKQDPLTKIRLEGKDLIVVSESVNIDQNGQQRFAFAYEKELASTPVADPLAILDSVFAPDIEPHDPVILCEAASALETEGNLQGAADLYRAALAAGGANPQINFLLAEILYRQGELSAARERYFSVIELDENFVEARANLGCVLAELGRDDLASAAFLGALKLHPDYAEVRLHYGMLLKRQGQLEEAEEQFRQFRELMPEHNDLEHFDKESSK